MNENRTELATFGAGCFWGVEEEFRKLQGVISTKVGYLGGNKDNPSYEEICSNETGHAEVVEVTFNCEKINYEQLLNLFWNIHNPTQLNRQGVDIGTQYRSAIFYHSEEQKEIAVLSKNNLEKINKYSRPIVTEISQVKTFWEAEEYHQQYLTKRGLSSCHI
ncbi:MAG: peptide-methionine (S)-S-oxide reductase [Ignavibacteria bacterium]|nr:peptide-methionine (S)-S-oxide reductase [Ignavibacteria bacterium]